MQGHNVVVVLVLIVALFGLVLAAPAEEAPEVSGLEQVPAMLVRSGPTQLESSARQCTNSACTSLCRSLGWSSGFCLDAEWCLCYN